MEKLTSHQSGRDRKRHGSVDEWNSFWKKEETFYVRDISHVTAQWELYEAVKFRYLAKLFPDAKRTASLECGCGTAGVSTFFASKGYLTTMLDSSPNALRLAKSNFNKERLKGFFVRADVEALPFKNHAFDVVMSYGLLEHFEDVYPAVQEMVRVLRPNGFFFADIVPKRFSVQTLGNLFFNLPVILLYYTLKLSPLAGIKRAYRLFRPAFFENSLSYNDYKNIFEKSELVDVKILGNNPFPTLLLSRPVEKIFVRLLKKTLTFWARFDMSDSWFSNQFWPRAWWASARKNGTQKKS